MLKTLLIARREYLAFVRTVGFWLSIFTLPLIIGASIFIPLMLHRSEPVQTVAVLDLSGDHLDGQLRTLVHQHEPKAPKAAAPGTNGAVAGVLSSMKGGGIRLVDLPAGLTPDMTLEEAEARIPAVLKASAAVSTILVAYDTGDKLHFHIWSDNSHKGDLEDTLQWDLHGMQYYKMAQMHGIDPALAHDMREARAEIESLTPTSATEKGNGFVQGFRDHAPRLLGALTGYLTWMSIFSSSMILLGSVIEEKSSKVLEVLLASVTTGQLLLGKVLGVACVLLTVAGIWIATITGLASYGMAFMPPETAGAVAAALSGMFSPAHIALLLAYFICGYLMFGIFFAAIGAFCETQKDAQAVMGPTMIILMIPMMTMQAAFTSQADLPVVRYMSYVPLFTPFLMPLRLSQPLPWWEIAATLLGMGVTALIMINMGRRAFRHGALTGDKLSWGALLGLGRRDI